MSFEVFYFTELPYPAFPESEADKFPSMRLTFPNTYFDPQTAHDLFKRYLDEYQYAEDVGFDGLMINEVSYAKSHLFQIEFPFFEPGEESVWKMGPVDPVTAPLIAQGNEERRAHYHYLREQSTCTQCWKAQTPGRAKVCAQCRAKISVYRTQAYAERKALGVCVLCAVTPAEEDRTECAECRDKRLEQRRRLRAKKEERSHADTTA